MIYFLVFVNTIFLELLLKLWYINDKWYEDLVKQSVNCMLSGETVIWISLWCFQLSLVILITLSLQTKFLNLVKGAWILKGQQTHILSTD